MIRGLRCVLGSASDKNSTVVCLDRTESYWDIEVNVKHLSLLSLVVHVVEGHNFLVKFEEMDFVCSNHLKFLLVLVCLGSVYHADACLAKVVCHSQLRVSVERDILSLSASGCGRSISIWEACRVVFRVRFNCSNHSGPIVICLRLWA